MLALEHDDKEKDILIQKLQEQIGQMATAMATLTAQISCQPSPALRRLQKGRWSLLNQPN